MLKEAIDLQKQGINVIFIKKPRIVKNERTGKDDIKGKEPIGTWKQFETEPTTIDYLESTYKARQKDIVGIGAILGPISGNLIDIDFDLDHSDKRLAAILNAILSWMKSNKPAAYYTGKGRLHLMYRVDDAAGIKTNGNLVRWDTKAHIELRFEGAYSCVPPTIHPETDKPYEWKQSTIPTLHRAKHDELIAILKSFNPEPKTKPTHWDIPMKPREYETTYEDIVREINSQHTIEGLLTTMGYRQEGDGFSHPQENHGPSVFIADCKSHHHGAKDPCHQTPFGSNNTDGSKSFDTFDLYCYSRGFLAKDEAIKALADELGFNETTHQAPTAIDDTITDTICLADVQPESINWLWEGFIARRKFHLVAGDPGLGKSWMTLDWASRVSTGKPWPNETNKHTPQNILLIQCEDGLADTIRPRLDTMGADTKRVHAHTLNVKDERGKNRQLNLSDIPTIEASIVRHRASLVIIDPVTAFLGDKDAHRNEQIRELMGPLAKLAERTNSAIVLVSHLNKQKGGSAIHRAIGSIGMIAAVRIGYLVVKDSTDTARRKLLPMKNNIGKDSQGLAYTITDDGIQWENTLLNESADDALADAPSKTDEAKQFLRDQLSGGKVVPSKELFDLGNKVGIAQKTLWRAKDELGIKAQKLGFNGGWAWSLPSSHTTIDEEAPESPPEPSEQSDILTFDEPPEPSQMPTTEAWERLGM